MPTVPDQLEKLAALLEKGLITREQFEEQRDRILAGDRASSPSSPSDPGSMREIGVYRLLERIGEGGMGAVYRGRHRSETMAERQGGDVAIKVMHPQYADNPEYRARFEREASLGMKLAHPNIVRVHDLLSDAGTLALVMEHVQGQPLTNLIGESAGPIPWQKALALMRPLLAAVGYAHEQGVVHRDLKPDNVLMTADGAPHVIDFGIAKDVEGSQTRTGTGMGTVEYMAPEQYLDAKAIDARADVYSLGMMLYEMLAGRLPWDADAPQFRILEIKARRELMSPVAFCADIPAPIVAALAPALAADPAGRYPSTAALGDALKRAEHEALAPPPLPATPAPPSTPSPSPSPAIRHTVAERGPDDHRTARDAVGSPAPPEAGRSDAPTTGSAVRRIVLVAVGTFVVGLLLVAVAAVAIVGLLGRDGVGEPGRTGREVHDRAEGDEGANSRISAAQAEHRAEVFASMDELDEHVDPEENATKHALFPDMAYVPQGYYLKGRWKNDEHAGASEAVEIARYIHGYWIDRYEFHMDDGTPLHSLTWNDAVSMCNEQGKVLCSEDQWEKACKGPEKLVYPYGDTYSDGTCPPSGLNRSSPYTVGSHQGCVSGYGVHDMAGGCWEWTFSKINDRKVTKGGYAPGQEVGGTRCAARKDEKPTFAHQNLSFRCCLDDDGIAAAETPPLFDPADLKEMLEGDTEERSSRSAPAATTEVADPDSGSTSPEESAKANIGGAMEITYGDVADMTAVKKYVSRKKGQIKSCYEAQLKVRSDLAGKVEIVWTVHPDGSVSGVSVVSNTTGDKPLEECIIRRIKRWQFPEQDEEVEITYPFNFFSG